MARLGEIKHKINASLTPHPACFLILISHMIAQNIAAWSVWLCFMINES